jgi:hypothetical protein
VNDPTTGRRIPLVPGDFQLIPEEGTSQKGVNREILNTTISDI